MTSLFPLSSALHVVGSTAQEVGSTATIADLNLWLLTVGGILLLLALDFAMTRRPHEVSMREAVAWSLFYVALPVAFGVWVWQAHGSQNGLEFYTGYLVEKSLSVDNLFLFILILGAFAVPRVLQQRVLLIGIAGALVLRAIFIALGAALIARFSWMFLIFGGILLVTAWGVLRDARQGGHAVDVNELRIVRITRRFFPITDDYQGTRLSVMQGGRRALTPLALVVIAILGTDLVFAIDSVPAVYGITGDPYLVFVTNAFALLGLRALYFLLEGALAKLRHLGYGLAAILAFIGVKLVLHWAHGIWDFVPTVPTLMSLAVIVLALVVTTLTSVIANRQERRARNARTAVTVPDVQRNRFGSGEGPPGCDRVRNVALNDRVRRSGPPAEHGTLPKWGDPVVHPDIPARQGEQQPGLPQPRSSRHSAAARRPDNTAP